MPFDADWFNELRMISENRLREMREAGIDGYVPHVGELRRDGHVTGRFLYETLQFVRLMRETPYCLDTFFRCYEQHVVNFPRGRAFRKQWNIAFTAEDDADKDHLRIGLGFRLSADTPGIVEYLEFRDQVSRQPAVFDRAFQTLGNYYEFWDAEPEGLINDNANTLSRLVINDGPSLNGWRFFGKRLWVRHPQTQEVLSSHERLRDTAIAVFGEIQRAGFGL